MPGRRYVIVGGGMAAAASIEGIFDADRSAHVTLVCEETHRPYDRPPLSKSLWRGAALESIYRKIPRSGVSLRLGTRAVAIDRVRKTMTDSAGTEHPYYKLLLAPGGAPRRLPTHDRHVIYLRTIDDYTRLDALSRSRAHFVVTGGGFIGQEIAAALASRGRKVTVVLAEKSLGARSFPETLGIFLNAYYRDRGVNLLCGTTLSALDASDGCVRVRTSSGNDIVADAVIAGIGIEPRVKLAREAGLRIGNGIVVDEFLRTSDTDIYAAGDVANFHCAALGMRMRVEHEDNANVMGRTAGWNMAGGSIPYRRVPFFYSDLFDLGYEAVGVLDARLDIVEDWKQQFRKGVVYYLKDDRVRGVLLWNTWGQVESARRLIEGGEKVLPSALAGRISD